MKINRREILKLSAGTLVAVLVSPFLSAQTNTTPVGTGPKTGIAPSSAIDGNISYNAGWVVPLEDKSGLLDLEARKTKEIEELKKQKAGTAPAAASGAKEESKSFSKRVQDIFGKVKNLF